MKTGISDQGLKRLVTANRRKAKLESFDEEQDREDRAEALEGKDYEVDRANDELPMNPPWDESNQTDLNDYYLVDDGEEELQNNLKSSGQPSSVTFYTFGEHASKEEVAYKMFASVLEAAAEYMNYLEADADEYQKFTLAELKEYMESNYAGLWENVFFLES